MAVDVLVAQADGATENPSLDPSTDAMTELSDAASALPIEAPMLPEGYTDQLLSFTYTLANWLGGLVVRLLETFLPLETPRDLVDPIGFLALLTIFLVVVQIAKKLTWLIVVVGWIFVGVRIYMEVANVQV